MLTHLKGQVTSIPRAGPPVHAEVAIISNIGIGMKYLRGWWTSEILLQQSDLEEWGVDNNDRHPPWVRSPLLELWSGWDLYRPQHCKNCKNCTQIGWDSSQNLTVLFLNRDNNKTRYSQKIITINCVFCSNRILPYFPLSVCPSQAWHLTFLTYIVA